MREEHFILQHLLNLRSEIDLSELVSKGPVYAKPTKPFRYDPVLPPDGNRKPAEMSPWNYRGYVPNIEEDRTMPIESDVERRAGNIFKANRDVVALRAQWPTRWYRGADGEDHEHTFDFWLVRKNGERVAVAAKPQEKIVSNNLIDTLKRLAAAGIADYADRISWVDEAFANFDDDENARSILHYRRRRNELEYDIARDLVVGTSGSFRFWDLVRIAPEPAHRIIAVWNLIDDGVLVPCGPGVITFSTYLTSSL